MNAANVDYTDNLFTTDNSSLYFEDGGSNETSSLAALVANSTSNPVKWHRVSENPHMQDSTLFGSNHITPLDIEQGPQLGNCWFMASMSALAEYEGRIEKLLLNKEKSANGIYAV